MVRACDAQGMSSIVRVPKLDHALIMQFLETGVQGVAVPHIISVQDAEAAVAAARFPPEGRRGHGVGSTRASGSGLSETYSDYFALSNREVLVAAWIEDKKAFENLNEILQVPGIDAICFGGGDLSLDMGYVGRKGHPEVQDVLAEGKKKVLAAGKALIGEPADAATARRMLDEGYVMLTTQVREMWAGASLAYLRELRGQR